MWSCARRLGWKDGQGGRKQADWLTQSQLKARTGRASEAISRAIDGLVQQRDRSVVRRRGRERYLRPRRPGERCAGRMLFGRGSRRLWTRRKPHRILRVRPCSDPPPISRACRWMPTVRLPNRGIHKANRVLSGFRTSQSEHDKRNSGQNHTWRCAAGRADGWGQRLWKTPWRVEQEESDRNRHGAQRPFGCAAVPPGVSGAVCPGRALKASRRRLRGDATAGWSRGCCRSTATSALLELVEPGSSRARMRGRRKRGYALSCFPTLLPTLLMEAGRVHRTARRRAFSNAGCDTAARPPILAAGRRHQRSLTRPCSSAIPACCDRRCASQPP